MLFCLQSVPITIKIAETFVKKIFMKNLNKVSSQRFEGSRGDRTSGSLPRAAEELGVSVSAVSQQLIRTEGQIGQADLRPDASGPGSDPFGKAFSPGWKKAFSQLSKAVALADGTDQTCCFPLPRHSPRNGSFRALAVCAAAHPDLKIRIDPSPGMLDLKSSDIDLAIRLGKGDWQDGTPECLLPQKMFPVCTRAFAERLRGPADIFNQPIICYDNPMFSWDDWQAATGLAGPLPFDGQLFPTRGLALKPRSAGRASCSPGISLSKTHLADGRLVAPFPTRVPSSMAYWLVSPKNRKPSHRCFTFRHWIRSEIAQGDANSNIVDAQTV